MKHFRETTLNKTIVMGRKTLESIGRALPKRKNIVLTTNANYVFPNVIIENDINNILSMKEDIYVIGGKQIYESFMPYADFLIVSVIEHKYDCDTFMKPIDNNKFNLKKEVINDGFKIQY
jgi:dihydrofolate reductase